MPSTPPSIARLRGGGAATRDEFYLLLDQAEAALERQHREAIQQAHSYHQRVQERAVRVKELYDLEQRSLVLEQEAEEARQLEAARVKVIEQEEARRKAAEAAEAASREAQAAEEAARQAEAARVNGGWKEAHVGGAGPSSPRHAIDEQAEPKQSEPASSGHPREGDGKAEASTVTGTKGTEAVSAESTRAPASVTDSRLKLHQEYLALHKRLKDFRKWMADLGKLDKQLKSVMGDQRREITKTVGQMTSGDSAEVKVANRNRIVKIKTVLQDAMKYPHSPVDIRQFFAQSHAQQVSCPDAEAQVSPLYVFLIHQLAKSVVRQYIREAGISPEKAEAVGLLVANTFTLPVPSYRGPNYIADVLLAKYHFRCPILFGVNRVPRDPDSTLQEDMEKMTGLAAGFAAITLRDFSRSQAKNPMPPAMFWKSFAMISNTKLQQRSDAHYLILKALLHPQYAKKFLRFYGDIGLAAARTAMLKFPEGSKTSAAQALKSATLIFERDLGLML